MIEKMKVVHIVAAASEKTALLDRLRTLGIVHFAEKASADQRHLERFAELSRMDMALQEYAGPGRETAPMSDKDFEPFYKELADCLERRKTLQEKKTAAGAAAEKLAEWGDFSPEELRELKDQGFDIHIYRTDKKTMAALAADPDVQIIRLAPVGKMPTLASIGPLPGTYPVTEFPIPDKGAGQLRRERDDCDQGLRSCQALLTEAAKHLPSIHDQMLKTQNAAEYSSVSNTSQSQDGLVWLTGYIPEAEAEGFKKAAAQAHWAWAMEDPAADDDKVPTKVKYNKVTRLMIPVFDILGVVPVKINSSVSRCINSCNYIKCSSFSCTVRSDQRNNLSFVDLNIHIINSHNTTELHGSIFNFQYIFTHWSLLLLLLSFFWTFQ